MVTQWLADEQWLCQNEVPVIGPEDLSYNEIAAIISQVTGREIRYQQIGLDRLKQQFLKRGATESFAQAYVDMFRAKNEDIDNVAGRDMVIRQTTSFRQWVEGHLKQAMAG